MATKTASHSSSVPQTKESITLIRQSELADFVALRNNIEKLEAEFKQKSDYLKDLLGLNVPVEAGVFIAQLKFESRRNPKWKDEAIKLADKLKGAGQGEKWADNILANTEATPIVKLDVH